MQVSTEPVSVEPLFLQSGEHFHVERLECPDLQASVGENLWKTLQHRPEITTIHLAFLCRAP
jgi:hypothetical protein